MGMYDNVNFKCKCPHCDSSELTGWQTKDGDCALDTVEIEDIKRMNTICPDCNAYVSVFKTSNEYSFDIEPQSFKWRMSWSHHKDADDIVNAFLKSRNKSL